MSPINLFKLRRIGCVLLLLILAGTFSSSLLAMVNPCDPANVSIDGVGGFEVSPSGDMTGLTDTTNFNCASDAIELMNPDFDSVKLKKGDFYITEARFICHPSKTCAFTGTTRASTILNIVDSSIDCNGRWENSIATAGLTARGNATVKFLTITGNEPCVNDGFLPSLLQFTGAPAVPDSPVIQAAGCPDSTMIGNVNRVSFVNTGVDTDFSLSVRPQGTYFMGHCRDLLTGSMTVTRSSIDGGFGGAEFSMHAGARVGVDYLTVTDTQWGIYFWDSFQVAQVNFCDITSASTADMPAYGIIGLRGEHAPNSTKVSINKCNFDMTSDMGSPLNVTPGVTADEVALEAIAMLFYDDSAPSIFDISVTGNRIFMAGANSTVFVAINIARGIFVLNYLEGGGNAAVELRQEEAVSVTNGVSLESTTLADPPPVWVTDWWIAGNIGLNQPAPIRNEKGASNTRASAGANIDSFQVALDHIFTGPGTQDNVIAFHEGLVWTEQGCNLYLNDIINSCAGGGAPIVNGESGYLQQSSTGQSRYQSRQVPEIASLRQFRRSRPQH